MSLKIRVYVYGLEHNGERQIALQFHVDHFRFTFNLALPSSLPRNGTAPSGRLLYWLVGSIEGLSHTAPAPPGNRHTTSRLPSSSRDGDSIENMRGSQSLHAAGADASSLPVYSERSPHGGALHRQTTSRCERRIAVSHNPNPEGGVNRLDDDFTHDLPGFGTCRTQVRVNEVRAREVTKREC